MKSSAMYALCVLTAGLFAAGCSFSVGNVHTVTGKEHVKVSAAQPELPPEPEVKPEPEPEPKAPVVVAPKPKRVRKAKLVGKKITISEKVMFEYNSAGIKVESHELLKDVAEVIKEGGKRVKVVKIEGHTDSDGKDDYNLDLSQRRADAVMEFLISAGVPEKKLDAEGFGETKAIADNATDEGKEKNRRVEFNLVEKKRKKKKNKKKKNK